jgi:hypothetical protein
MRDDKDRSSKWMIDHHGDGLLRLAGVTAWRAVQPEVVQPRQLPDGLLEVFFPDQPAPDLFLVEIATYPQRRVEEQVLRDALIVFLDRRVLPEVITLVLHPKGQFRLTGREHLASRIGMTEVTWGWRVIELWTVPAQDLLAAGDVGLIPWALLAQYDGPPEALFQECQTRIEQLAPPEEKANLYAVAQVMGRLRYNDPRLLSLLGGKRVMIESPLIQELMAEQKQQDIVEFLEGRFGKAPSEVVLAIQSIKDVPRLKELIRLASQCPDLGAFRSRVIL